MPRPDVTPAFIAGISSPYVKPALFVQVTMTTGTVNVWSGIGSIGWNGGVYVGVGNFGAISSVEEGTDVLARGIVLTLSGFDPTLLTDALSNYQQGLPVKVYLGLFDANNALIPNPITCWSGRTDQPTITVDGPTATLAISCESRLVELNTSVQFRYDTETQQIFFPGDHGLDFTAGVTDLTLYWGRHPSVSNNTSVRGYSG